MSGDKEEEEELEEGTDGAKERGAINSVLQVNRFKRNTQHGR